MAFSLDTQPLNMLHHIALFIDDPQDLLFLSLTSRRFLDIVSPRRLYFRRIRCDPHRRSLWDAIASRKDVAKRFGRLELFREEQEGTVGYVAGYLRLPWSWDSFDQAEDLEERRSNSPKTTYSI